MIEDRSTANADPSGKTTYVFQDRAGKPGGGKGPLVSNGYYPTMTGHPFMMCTEESVISFEGNGCRPSHKGVGFSDEGVMYTLNTTEVHGVMYPVYGIDQQGGKGHAAYSENVMPTILSDSHGTPHAVAYPEQIAIPIDRRNELREKSDNSGIGKNGDKMYTVTATGNIPAVCTDNRIVLMDQGGAIMSVMDDQAGTIRAEMGGHPPIVLEKSIWVDRHVNIGTDDLAPTLCAKYGTGGNNMPCVIDEPIAYAQNATDSRVLPINDDVCPTLNTRIGSGGPNAPLIREPIGAGNFPVMCNAQHCYNIENDKTPCLIARAGTGGNNIPMSLEDTNMNEMKYVVRRITPRECERLQGFPTKGEIGPDGKVMERDYTDIPWPKGQCPDSHRYKALGNSMAVPVMRLIAESIDFALSHPITEDKSDKIAYQTSLFDF